MLPADRKAAAPAPEGALEAASCPLCETPPPAGGYRFPPYRVVRCPRCRTWYLSPRLAEAAMLRAYRADSYFESAGEGEGGAPGYSSYLAQEPTLRATFRRLLARMRRLGMTGGRLLEVGCAYGFFLDEARGDFRWRAGTEYSPAAAARARLMADAVYQGGLDEVPAEERFDCAVLIHVIEHVYRPRELVARLVERLRPGGWVVLAAPDMEGFWRPLLGRRWPFFKVPEHVTYFARPSLTQLLAAAGCRRVEPLPYEGSFALELIAEKLGVSLPRWLGRRRLWLPATTAACAGQRPA